MAPTWNTARWAGRSSLPGKESAPMAATNGSLSGWCWMTFWYFVICSYGEPKFDCKNHPHDYHISSDSNVVISNKILKNQNLPSISGMLCHACGPTSQPKKTRGTKKAVSNSFTGAWIQKPIISGHFFVSWYLKLIEKSAEDNCFFLQLPSCKLT